MTKTTTNDPCVWTYTDAEMIQESQAVDAINVEVAALIDAGHPPERVQSILESISEELTS